jgi:hypothetical protein
MRAVAVPFDQARVPELAQPGGQAGAGRAGAGLDVVEAGHAEAQLPDREQGPPVADDLQRVGDRADPPLRVPLGAPARAILAARHEAPDTVPFVPGQQPQPVSLG